MKIDNKTVIVGLILIFTPFQKVLQLTGFICGLCFWSFYQGSQAKQFNVYQENSDIFWGNK